MKKVNAQVEWHVWPQEQPHIEGEIEQILVRRSDVLKNKYAHYIYHWVQTESLPVGWYLNGNPDEENLKGVTFEWLYINQL